MPNQFEVFMDTLRKYKPIHMSALFKDNDEIKTITFTEKDITSIVNDFDNDTMNKLIENKPEKRVFIENFKEFLDPELCCACWDELLEVFNSNTEFNSMYDYYQGVYDVLVHIYNGVILKNDPLFNFLQKEFYSDKYVIKVSLISESNNLDDVDIKFEVENK